MNAIRNHLFIRFLFICFLLFMFLSFPLEMFSIEVEWLEVSMTNNEIISIDPKSIKYNNKGFLTVMVKHSDIVQGKQAVINEDTFLMAIDCQKRLFSKFTSNADLTQVKNWKNPINNKLIKKLIINSCSY